MKLNYLLTGLSFILVQYITSASPMGNEEVALQDTQVYRRDTGAHLEKRKKKNRYGAFGNYMGKHRKHNRGRYFPQGRYGEMDDYKNPRYFNPEPATTYGTPFGAPIPATDPFSSNPMPMDSVSSASNPTMNSASMNGASSAGSTPNPAYGASAAGNPANSGNPATAGNPATSGGAPSSNSGSAAAAGRMGQAV